jgi:hypothetical protein
LFFTKSVSWLALGDSVDVFGDLGEACDDCGYIGALAEGCGYLVGKNGMEG